MSTTAPLNLAIIIASTRAERFGPTVAAWFRDRAAEYGDLHIDLIDLAETPLPQTLDRKHGDPPEVSALATRLARADAFVIVTPEYNRGYPAPLKTAIDWYVNEWQAKPIGFVGYGGMSGGLRAIEQLRQVFTELHATTVRDTVSFHSCWTKFDDAGVPLDATGAAAAAKALLDQLAWWARALRDARAIRPYGA